MEQCVVIKLLVPRSLSYILNGVIVIALPTPSINNIILELQSRDPKFRRKKKLRDGELNPDLARDKRPF